MMMILKLIRTKSQKDKEKTDDADKKEKTPVRMTSLMFLLQNGGRN